MPENSQLPDDPQFPDDQQIPNDPQIPDPHKPYRPYALWFETLPNGDTVQVYLSPHGSTAGVIGHWNGTLCRYECCANLAEARLRGWEWWAELFDSPTLQQPELAELESEALDDSEQSLRWSFH